MRYEEYCHRVWMVLADRHGTRKADVMIDPLIYYIFTGRAPSAFLKTLLTMEPSKIADILERGGSIDESIASMKAVVWYNMCHKGGKAMKENSHKVSEAKKRAHAKYDAKTAKYYSLKFNRGTDADIIEYLAKIDNFQGYIKALIRDDIKLNSYENHIAPGFSYSDPDGTYKVLRVNGNDVMIEGEDGKKYATTVEEIEKYLQPLQ